MRMRNDVALGIIQALGAAVQEAQAAGQQDFDLGASLQSQGQQAIDELQAAIDSVKAKAATP